MKMWEIRFENGDSLIRFYLTRADAWYNHPMAYTIVEIVII